MRLDVTWPEGDGRTGPEALRRSRAMRGARRDARASEPRVATRPESLLFAGRRASDGGPVLKRVALLALGVAWMAGQDTSEAQPAVDVRALATAESVRHPGASLSLLEDVPFAFGHDYKARFEANGVRIVPRLGPDAPKSRHLAFEVESIRRGASVLYAAPPTGEVPFASGRSVHYRRGPSIVESYEVLDEGLDLTVRFDALGEGPGDLVVRGRVTSDLPPPPAGERPDPLTWHLEGVGGVRIGSVTGVDARGRRAPGLVRFDGLHLDLVLPGSFVDQAEPPVVLDPLLGPVISVGGAANSTGDSNPDVAYDFSNDLYLVVYQHVWAADNVDIFGWRIDASTGLSYPGDIPITGGAGFPVAGVHRNAAVANVEGTNRFLVAWEQSESGAIAGPWDVKARAISADLSEMSGVIEIAATALNEHDPDVGGQSTPASNETFVVWDEEGTLAGIRGRRVTVPGPPLDPVPGPAITIGYGEPETPAITKHAGDPRRWLVAWRTIYGPNYPPGVENGILAQEIDDSGNTCGDIAVLAVGPNSAPMLYPDCAGDGTDYMIAWQAFSPGMPGLPAGWNIHCIRASHVACDSDLLLSPSIGTVAASADDEYSPSADWCGDEYIVAWSREPFGGDSDVWVAGFDLEGCNYVCEGPFLVEVSPAYDGDPAVCAQKSGFTLAGHGALIAWGALSFSASGASTERVKARRFLCAPGSNQALGGGCGGGGQASATCAAVGSPSFTHNLSGATPNSPALLLVSTGTWNQACGSCTIVPDPFTNAFLFLTQTGATGSASIVTPLPALANLAGLVIYEQWAVFPGTGCSAFGVDLSNGLEVTIGT